MAKEDEDPDPSTPTPKRKVSNINNGAGTTPTKRTPLAGPRTPTTARKTSAQKNATPIRQASAGNKTPNSAPVARGKRAEPTLLGDFLLGRPSPGRRSVNTKNATTTAARRKSLDAVKAEMRVNNVQMMQQPGKVQERVKQWQKSNAKAGDPEIEKGLDEIVVEYETDSEVEVRKPERKSRTPEPRLRGGDASSPRPGRRKDKDEKDAEKPRSKSVAPKKRVISDEHWMKNRRRSPPGKGSTIPKNFLQATAINPPVERKIEDWVKRMASPEPPERVETPKRKVRRAESEDCDEKPRVRKVSKRSPNGRDVRARPSRTPSPDDGIRIKPSKDRPSLRPEPDDGIRITPFPQDDGIRIRPSDVESVQSEIQIKRTRNDGSKRRPKDDGETPTSSPRKKSEHLAPPTESESRSRKTSYTTTIHDDDATSYLTSSPSKRRDRKSDVTESLDDIPFGNSAFSVLDLPVGAEANTMKRAERPEPKRNNSFAAVPKVLKRVYTEGMKRVHDPEPPRGGPNQPPSIEKWLNGTTDPFVERPSIAGASLPVPDAPVSRMRSFREDDRTEHELTAEREHKPTGSTPKRAKEHNSPGSPLRRGDNRGTLPSMGNSPPISPLGLKRTPATRVTSSPKTGKKFGLKDAIFDAFKGESAMAKTTIPTPFDFIGVRVDEITNTETESSIVSDFEEIPRKSSPKTSPRTPERSTFENVENKTPRPAFSYAKRPPPIAGGASLSTIASVTSYSNSSSATSDTGTGSELSHTTITQNTVLSRNTGSSLSLSSKKSTSKKEGQTGHTSLKRRLTKHEDLVSMLSLPDTPPPKKAASIRSMRSVRSGRPRLEDASIEDLLREVGQDEIKYMRELNTLVDGVIPVLLTCVLSKSDSAVQAGLFEPLAYATSGSDSSFTKPIVDMGIALERLKSLHKRIALTDPNSFLLWAQQSLKIYEDYLRAWRTGFEDVVVNLAPASCKESLSWERDMDILPVNDRGDVIKETGKVVDVAHLLKAPMKRVKLLGRVAKGIESHCPTELSQGINLGYENLNTYRQERMKAENDRKEDLKAINTDTTLARDPKTLEPAEGVTIERFRQVSMKDVFGFDMWHSNGQRIECEVEATFRKDLAKLSSDHDLGDILISQVTTTKSHLLFPPISMYNISARVGDKDSELVVMIRDAAKTWSELIILDAVEKEVADEWLEMLPMNPVPGNIVRKTKELDPEVLSMISAPGVDLKSVVGTLKKKVPQEPPIGERHRREYEDPGYSKKKYIPEAPTSPELPPLESYGPMTSARKRINLNTLKTLSTDNVYNLKDLNETLVQSGSKPLKRFKNESNPDLPSASPWVIIDSKIELVMSGALAVSHDEHEFKEVISECTANGQDDIGRTLHIPKLRSPTPKNSTPLTESMRPDFEHISKNRPTSPRDDGAPPPPAHRSQVTSPELKNIPVIDNVIPKPKNRRGSSPLKHEYQPSADSAATSVAEDISHSDDYTSSDLNSSSDDDSIDELDDDELAEMADEARTLPSHSMIHGRDDWLPASAESLAPSNSASQVPAVEAPILKVRQFVAMVTYWTNCWNDVHKEACIVNVGPGWVDVFEPDNEFASRDRDEFNASSTSLIDPSAAIKNPLLSQELTPNVNIRTSTAVDVQVASPISENSRFRKSASNIQYRFLSQQACIDFSNAISEARLHNKKWNHLSYQREVSNYGPNNQVQHKRQSWFSRKPSFRRARSDLVNSAPPSVGDSGTSSPLRRFRGGGLFNIGRSSVSQKPGGMSSHTSSSGFSNISPPDTPSGSQAPSGSFWGSALPLTGTKDLPITLRQWMSKSGTRGWLSHGPAFITISEPDPEQRQLSSQNHGRLRHIMVTLKPIGKSQLGRVILDEVLGADCFQEGGPRGIFVTIFREMVDERKVVGAVPARGGVGGTTEKWCFQSRSKDHNNWILTLLKSVVTVEGM